MNPELHVLARLKYKYGIDTSGFVQTDVAQLPSHGQVAMIGLDNQSFSGATFEVFQYTPNKDYLGEDKVAFEVTVHGKKFRVSYVIHVQKQLDDEVCRPPGEDRGELGPSIQVVIEYITNNRE